MTISLSVYTTVLSAKRKKGPSVGWLGLTTPLRRPIPRSVNLVQARNPSQSRPQFLNELLHDHPNPQSKLSQALPSLRKVLRATQCARMHLHLIPPLHHLSHSLNKLIRALMVAIPQHNSQSLALLASLRIKSHPQFLPLIKLSLFHHYHPPVHLPLHLLPRARARLLKDGRHRTFAAV